MKIIPPRLLLRPLALDLLAVVVVAAGLIVLAVADATLGAGAEEVVPAVEMRTDWGRTVAALRSCDPITPLPTMTKTPTEGMPLTTTKLIEFDDDKSVQLTFRKRKDKNIQ